MTQMQHPFVSDHYVLGWVLFGGLFFAFLFILARYFRYSEESTSIPNVSLSGNGQTKSFSPRSLLLVAIPCLVALTGPLLLSIFNSAAEAENHASFSLPAAIGNWKRADGSTPVWQTRFSGYDYSDIAHYSNDAGNVQLTVYQYIQQRQGKEAVSGDNVVYDLVAEPLGREVIDLDAGHIGSVQERLFRQGPRKQLVWYWYHTVGKGTANPLFAKMLGVWGRLINEPSVLVFIVTSDATRSISAARDRLEDFTNALSSTTLVSQ